MTAPPIIIIHRGDSPYLAYTIAQAKESNPNSRIILLGDRSNSFYLGVEHHFYQDYFAEAEQFSKLFRYEHFPNYQYSWILFCHQKYFFLRDFCKKQQISKLLLIDSDVMVYDDIRGYFHEYLGSAMTLSSSGGLCAQASFAIVNDCKILARLCEIYTKMFSKRIEDLKKEIPSDLFTEMVGLGVLMKQEPTQIVNTYHKTADGIIFNHSIVEDNRFEFNGSMLKLQWRDNIPYLQEKISGTLIKTPFLHFHGKGKYVMRKYLKIKSNRLVKEVLINKLASSFLKYPRRFINKIARRSIYSGI
jgi:hypothetical protein